MLCIVSFVFGLNFSQYTFKIEKVKFVTKSYLFFSTCNDIEKEKHRISIVILPVGVGGSVCVCASACVSVCEYVCVDVCWLRTRDNVGAARLC